MYTDVLKTFVTFFRIYSQIIQCLCLAHLLRTDKVMFACGVLKLLNGLQVHNDTQTHAAFKGWWKTGKHGRCFFFFFINACYPSIGTPTFSK